MPLNFTLNDNISSRCGRLFETIPFEEIIQILKKFSDLVPSDSRIIGSNYGQINLVYLLKRSDQTIPERVLIISRPDRENAYSDTVADFHGLKLVYDNFQQLLNNGAYHMHLYRFLNL